MRSIPTKNQKGSFQWSSNDYEKFYEAVEMFKDNQFGNKKIAKYMKEQTNLQIDAAQIRFEKVRYQKEQRKLIRQQAARYFEVTKNGMKDDQWI